MNTTATKRGCGERQTDGIYFESELSPFGRPLEDFLIDPPHPCFENGITWSRSYQVFEREIDEKNDAGEVTGKIKINHLIDWVGEEFYPSIWDFIEETRDKGISRRVSKDFDFSLITPFKSKIFFAHKKSRFDDTRHEYGHPWKFVPPEDRTRITMLTPKSYYPPTDNISVDKNIMKGNRVVGDLKYRVAQDTTLDHSVAALKDGLFMFCYITKTVYVRPTDPKMIEKIKKLNIDIEIVDE